MPIKKSLILAVPALLAAVTLGPVAASTASATQALADTTATISQTSTHVQPPKERQRERQQYKRGRTAGFTEGRADCRGKMPYDLRSKNMGTGVYQHGFSEGYNSGWKHCTPTR
ncbi:hypothetical protein [Nonomuraea sp. NPDC049784]|uniref:hypothetical protein n=1 Tax=Nonomuraea sp. NPDC049784 TaxID=3154361 RepID=UPI0033F886F1